MVDTVSPTSKVPTSKNVNEEEEEICRSQSNSPQNQAREILFISPKCSRDTSIPVKKLLSPKEYTFPMDNNDANFELPTRSPKPAAITTPQRKHTTEMVKEMREIKRRRTLSQSSEDDFVSSLFSSPFSNGRVQSLLGSQDSQEEAEFASHSQSELSVDNPNTASQTLFSDCPPQTSSLQTSSTSGPLSKTLSFLSIISKGRFQSENRVRDSQTQPFLLLNNSQTNTSTNAIGKKVATTEEVIVDRDLISDEPSDMELSQHLGNFNDSFESDNSFSYVKQTPPLPKSALLSERYLRYSAVVLFIFSK